MSKTEFSLNPNPSLAEILDKIHEAEELVAQLHANHHPPLTEKDLPLMWRISKILWQGHIMMEDKAKRLSEELWLTSSGRA